MKKLKKEKKMKNSEREREWEKERKKEANELHTRIIKFDWMWERDTEFECFTDEYSLRR